MPADVTIRLPRLKLAMLCYVQFIIILCKVNGDLFNWRSANAQVQPDHLKLFSVSYISFCQCYHSICYFDFFNILLPFLLTILYSYLKVSKLIYIFFGGICRVLFQM